MRFTVSNTALGTRFMRIDRILVIDRTPSLIFHIYTFTLSIFPNIHSFIRYSTGIRPLQKSQLHEV